MLCFLAAVIWRKGKEVGKGLSTGLNVRDGISAVAPEETGGEGVARGEARGDPRGELRSLKADPEGVGSPPIAAPKTGMKGLITGWVPLVGGSVVREADETRLCHVEAVLGKLEEVPDGDGASSALEVGSGV